MTGTMNQKARILELLQERGQIGLTALESMELANTMRLAAYIKFLRDDGYSITTHRITVPSGKHVARYVLELQRKPNGLLFDVSKPAERQ